MSLSHTLDWRSSSHQHGRLASCNHRKPSPRVQYSTVQSLLTSPAIHGPVQPIHPAPVAGGATSTRMPTISSPAQNNHSGRRSVPHGTLPLWVVLPPYTLWPPNVQTGMQLPPWYFCKQQCKSLNGSTNKLQAFTHYGVCRAALRNRLHSKARFPSFKVCFNWPLPIQQGWVVQELQNLNYVSSV